MFWPNNWWIQIDKIIHSLNMDNEMKFSERKKKYTQFVNAARELSLSTVWNLYRGINNIYDGCERYIDRSACYNILESRLFHYKLSFYA